MVHRVLESQGGISGNRAAHDPHFVRISNGAIQFFLPPAGTPYCMFGIDAVSAVLQGDNVFVQCDDGRTQAWNINPSGKSVMGPVKTIRRTALNHGAAQPAAAALPAVAASSAVVAARNALQP